ncbi:F0F1 ATP synthase subunit B [Bartonella sp. LJL80]
MTDTFWALIGLLLFIAILVAIKIPGKTAAFLDDRARRINDELEEARRMREEAQQVLAEYQRKRAEAEKEAEDIVAAAKREAASLAEEARKKTEDYVARRNKLAEQKISQAEAEAVSAVRSSAVDLAVAAASEIINRELDAKKADSLIKLSLNEVKTRMN